MNASDLVRQAVVTMCDAGRAAILRVGSGAPDDEAVHDARVELRRLRSILRAGADLYASHHVRATRDELAEAALRMGALRDEEALGEVLAELRLDRATREAVDAWQKARLARRGPARRALAAWARTAAATRGLDLARALVILPVAKKLDTEATAFAAACLARAERDVEKRRFDRDDDTELHELRIRFKRLRYVAKAFAVALPPEAAQREAFAKRMQELLGRAHDAHIGRLPIGRARALSPLARSRVGEALDRFRARSLDEAAQTLAPPLPNAARAPR